MTLESRLISVINAIGADIKSIKNSLNSGVAPIKDTGWRRIYGDSSGNYWEIQFRRVNNTVELISSAYNVPVPNAYRGEKLSASPGFKPNQGVGDVQFWAWYFPSDIPIRMTLKADGTFAYAGVATGVPNTPEIPSLSATTRYSYFTSDPFPSEPYPGTAV